MTASSTLMRPRDLPWHNASTSEVDGLQTAEQALSAAGLDWEVQLKQNRYDVYKDGKTVRMKSRAYSVVRTDSWEEIGVVGSRYRTLSNARSFQFLNGLVEEGAVFEAAGSQKGGSRVFIVMKLPEGIKVLGSDSFDQYVFFLTSHDGSLAVTATPLVIRVTCTNMFRSLIASAKGEQQVWKAQHLATLDSKVEDVLAARKSLDLVVNGESHFKRLAERLVGVKVNGEDGDNGFYELMRHGLPWEGSARDKLVEGVRTVWHTSETIDPDQRFTAWGVLNAFTEYIGHERSYQTPESRLNNILFTLGATIERNLTRGLSRLAS